jgi:DNA-binding transcriptional ArsR family regulator
MPTTGRVRTSEQLRPTAAEIDAVYNALAHEARRQIVLVLSHFGPELPSGYLANRFTHSWPTTTRHLRVLQDAGVVSVRRDGRNSWYRLERDHVERVLSGWLDLLNPPNRDRIWRSPGPRSVKKGSSQ